MEGLLWLGFLWLGGGALDVKVDATDNAIYQKSSTTDSQASKQAALLRLNNYTIPAKNTKPEL